MQTVGMQLLQRRPAPTQRHCVVDGVRREVDTCESGLSPALSLTLIASSFSEAFFKKAPETNCSSVETTYFSYSLVSCRSCLKEYSFGNKPSI